MEVRLDNIIQKKLEEKLTNGEIEKTVSNALDKCIDEIINDMFSRYNSSLRGELIEKLQPVLSNAIANSTVEGLSSKLTLLINKIMEGKEITSIDEECDNYSNLKEVTGNNAYKFDQEIKLSEIFKMYKDFVEKKAENLSYNTDELEYDDGEANVYWNLELEELDEDEENKHSYFSSNRYRIFKLSARPENDDNIEEDEYNFDIKFKIYKNYNDKCRLQLLGELNINDLIHAPKFILDLYQISNKCCTIIIDKAHFSDDVCVSVEQEY